MVKKRAKTNFKPYQVGTIFNPLALKVAKVKPILKAVEITYPSRLNAMALDSSKIAANQNLVYTPGEVIFKVKIDKKIRASIDQASSEIRITPRSRRVALIRHAALLMKTAIGFKHGLVIDVDNRSEIKHAGLGSSSGLIASVACAINELYGNPIKPGDLLQYLAQNHGEEIERKVDQLCPVQCIGGSASAGLFEGAFIILAGQSRVIASMDLPSDYQVIIGIPKDFKQLDSRKLLKREIAVFDQFIWTGKKYGKLIAYRVLHQVLPATKEGDLKTIGDLIFDYRYKMGSIKNCAYCYPPLVSLTNRLAYLKEKGLVDVLSISSVGPGIFAIGRKMKECQKAFERENLVIHLTKLENRRYQVIKKVKYY